MHRLPYHHFSGVHVKSLIHPHGAILELSGQTGCTSCYTGAYFPFLAMDMIVFLHICYGLHYSADGCLFTLLCHCFSDFYRDEPSEVHNSRVLTIPPSMTLQ